MRHFCVSDIFKVADEINSHDLVRNGIVSVNPAFLELTRRKAADSLAMHGLTLTDGLYDIRVTRSLSVQPESGAHSDVWAYKSGACIEIAAENRCWLRMDLAKELAHLYVGMEQDEYHDFDLLLTASRTARDNLPAHGNEEIRDDEMFCFYLAIEVLLPWGPLRTEAMDMHASGKTDLEIANRFKIPVRIITHFFDGGWSKWSWEGHRGPLG